MLAQSIRAYTSDSFRETIFLTCSCALGHDRDHDYESIPLMTQF